MISNWLLVTRDRLEAHLKYLFWIIKFELQLKFHFLPANVPIKHEFIQHHMKFVIIKHLIDRNNRPPNFFKKSLCFTKFTISPFCTRTALISSLFTEVTRANLFSTNLGWLSENWLQSLKRNFGIESFNYLKSWSRSLSSMWMKISEFELWGYFEKLRDNESTTR